MPPKKKAAKAPPPKQGQEAERGVILELRAANSELAAKNDALNTAFRELETFSYSVVHDLRAPVRAIDGFSRLALSRYSDALGPEGRELLERMNAASQRMDAMIDSILELSQLSRLPVTPADADLSELAATLAAALKKSAPARAAEFVVAPGLRAEADPYFITVVLRNLLDNAWKFTSAHPRARIEFGAAVVDGETAYFVRDDGAGFDPAYAGKLFVPLQRLHGRAEFPGSGVGLAIVARIIARHGGRTWAEGAVEKGATFYFTLPKR